MIFGKLKPSFRAQSIYGVDWHDAWEKGYRGMILDIDNTLVPHDAPADEKSRAFLAALLENGWKLIVLSNNREERAASFCTVCGIPWISDAKKPRPDAYRKAVSQMGLAKDRVICVGDQLFTDIWGANNAGLCSLLTDPVAPASDKWWIKLKRVLEFPIKHLHNVEITSKITKDF